MPSEDISLGVLDVETTGTQVGKDQIIELCIQSGLGKEAPSSTWRFKPEEPISKGAQRVHGISADDLKDCSPFAVYADEIRELLQGFEVLVGYRINFDLDFILAEFRRFKLALPDLSNAALIDPYAIWCKMEPRTLADAHKRFAGGEFSGAHCATDDVAATGRVLSGMLSAFGLEKKSYKEVSALCELKRGSWIGPSYHFQWKNEVAVFGFGKHKSRPILDVAKEDNGSYLRWLAKQDFPQHVIDIAVSAPEKDQQEFKDWLQQNFG